MRRLTIVALAATWLMLSPATAGAWVDLDGNSSAPHPIWQSLPVSWMLNNAGSADLGGFAGAEAVLLDSFATWEAPSCTNVRTNYTGGTLRQPGYDNNNVQAWSETGWTYESYAIGVTSLSFYSSTRLAEADIDYNGQHYTWSTTGGGGSTVDTQSIATHEMGHFLGLGDLYGADCSGDPTMCGTYSGGTGSRTLATDDINGICTLYPSGSGDCVVDGDCPSGYTCESGVCVPITTAGALCDPCTDHDECGGTYDYCLSGFPDGNAYCGQQCNVDGDCPGGYNCTDVGTSVGQCVPDSLDCSATPDCVTDGDCPSGYTCEGGMCVPGTTPDCVTDGDCPAGYICDGGTCVPDTTPDCYTNADCPDGYICSSGVCVPDPSPHLPLCAECTEHDQCGGPNDLCMGGFIDGTQRCGVACESVGGECGEGNICFDFPDLPDQCIPSSMDCSPDCSTDADCPPGEHCDGGYCTNFCDPRNVSMCPDGYYCEFMSCSTGVCSAAPDGPGPLGLGQACTQDQECSSLWCKQMVNGSYCTAQCNFVSGGVCPAPSSCQPEEGGLCGYCSCSAGRLGDACQSDSDCQAGTCGEEYGVGNCIQDCTDPGFGCTGGFTCTPVGDGSRSLCIPSLASMGQPCTSNEDCFDGYCTAFAGRQFCSRMCDTLGCTCPGGFNCAPTSEEGVSICVASTTITSGCGCAIPGSGSSPSAPLVLLVALLGAALLGFRLRRR